MKKNFTLSISQSCSEKWQNFTPNAQGGFCSSCSKTVIDFTGMTEEQIFAFFTSNTAHTCGRFRPGQLKGYAAIPMVKIRPGFSLLKAGVVSLLLLLVSKQVPAQDVFGKSKTEITHASQQAQDKNYAVTVPKIIRGIVKDEIGYEIPGVNVLIKGTTMGTTTDSNGKFELTADFMEDDILVFTFIGYKYEEYKVKQSTSDVIDITMSMEADIMGTVAVAGVYEPEPTGLRKLWKKVKSVF